MEKLNESELKQALKSLPEWQLTDGSLVREWKFKDFLEAIAFVNRIATVAEAAGHHPDIDIRYNRVKLGLVTHDAGGITASDVDMAKKLNAV